eukprot:2302672-Rhodomonas_salina.1
MAFGRRFRLWHKITLYPGTRLVFLSTSSRKGPALLSLDLLAPGTPRVLQLGDESSLRNPLLYVNTVTPNLTAQHGVTTGKRGTQSVGDSSRVCEGACVGAYSSGDSCAVILLIML